MIDFSVNINPLGPSKKVIEAAKRALLQSAAYPDCKCRKLREKLADRLRVDERMFAFGNGAAELLYCPGRKIEESSPPHSLVFRI